VEGNVYNVGSGVGHTIGDIVEQVLKVAGADKPVRREEERVRPAKSEVGRLVCDYSRAAAAFGYAPSVSLAEGLGQVRDYLRSHPPAGDSNVYRV
jgi:NDP-hexose 4,6-dehydratase